MPYMRTKSGNVFDLNTFTHEDFTLQDIAYALAGERRYAANAPLRVNVAIHSVAVSHLVPPELALAALFHDAAEMVTGDIPKPVKNLIPKDAPFFELVRRVEAAIAKRFGFSAALLDDPRLKEADRKCYVHELIDMYGIAAVKMDRMVIENPLTPADSNILLAVPLWADDSLAQNLFKDRYKHLTEPPKTLETIQRAG